MTSDATPTGPGPMEKRLIARKAAILAVPKGGGSADAIRVLTDKVRLARVMTEATEWVREAIDVCLTAPDVATVGTSREGIAEAILKKIEERGNG